MSKILCKLDPRISDSADPFFIYTKSQTIPSLLVDTTAFYTYNPLVQDILWEVGTEYRSPLVITNRTFDGIEFEEAILL